MFEARRPAHRKIERHPIEVGGAGLHEARDGADRGLGVTRGKLDDERARHSGREDAGQPLAERPLNRLEQAQGGYARARSSRRSLYSIESTSASQDASMMFSATPTVPHVSSPSPDVISTRVFAPVPADSSRMRTL